MSQSESEIVNTAKDEPFVLRVSLDESVRKAIDKAISEMASEPVLAFAMEMERELEIAEKEQGYPENGWMYANSDYLLDRALHNMQQVRALLNDKGDPDMIRKACADTANFMMMVADNRGNLRR